ncbi:MAG: lipid-A-disaccharide synthase [Flavisolibacter sp.]
MRYYIISGEASGDLHGSYLIKALRTHDPQANIRCWGGDMMQAAGGEVVKHYRDLAFMGFAEVVKNLPTIFKNLKFCKQDILSYQPDVVILVDYPGFNMRIAKWAKTQNLKVVYYISPQVWAWKQGRVKTIKNVVDKMLVILPFEKEFYESWDYPVSYVGHPLADVVAEAESAPQKPLQLEHADRFDNNKPTIALLPGSREQEIRVKLPVMLAASRAFPQYNFVVAQAPSQPVALYRELATPYLNVSIAQPGQTYSLLKQSTAALVTSGTATLETALFGVPQVVCYKGSPISYQIAKRVVKVRFISLVNLIMDREVVKELIQHEMTVDNVVKELRKIMEDEQAISRMKDDYRQLKEKLRQEQPAAEKAATEILSFLKN